MAKLLATVILFVLCTLGSTVESAKFSRFFSKSKDDAKAAPPVPTFSHLYTVKGVISLPYAEIKEPFKAWFDANANKSRIDYYDGMMTTYQRADKYKFGASYKIVPFTNDSVTNLPMCFGMNGTANATVGIQSVLPDTKAAKFSYVGRQDFGGQTCDVFRNTSVVGTKMNTYTLYVTADAKQAPVRYEMKGYDSLLGSHYDKYSLDYFSYKPDVAIDPSVFEISNMTCSGFPGPGVAKEERVAANPMSEFIDRDESHHQEAFDNFKKGYAKVYPSAEQHAQRATNFRHNLRFVHSKNRAGLTYSLRINHLADLSDGELRYMRGKHSSRGKNNGKPFDKGEYAGVTIPDSIDWRLYGAVTPVKDQAVCGSCWSFGTTGAIEGVWFRKTGYLTRLSQQMLMDCSWGEGNNACDGGEEWRALDWLIKHGGVIASEDTYGPYLGADGYCHYKNVTGKGAIVKSYVNVTSGDQDALKMAIGANGPVAVDIDAAHRSLSFYANGVYYEPECKNGVDDLDHSVLAVGYGTMNGQPYWLVKNSWSTYWGNDGYVLISLKDNNCGVATSPTLVEV